MVYDIARPTPESMTASGCRHPKARKLTLAEIQKLPEDLRSPAAPAEARRTSIGTAPIGAAMILFIPIRRAAWGLFLAAVSARSADFNWVKAPLAGTVQYSAEINYSRTVPVPTPSPIEVSHSSGTSGKVTVSDSAGQSHTTYQVKGADISTAHPLGPLSGWCIGTASNSIQDRAHVDALIDTTGKRYRLELSLPSVTGSSKCALEGPRGPFPQAWSYDTIKMMPSCTDGKPMLVTDPGAHVPGMLGPTMYLAPRDGPFYSVAGRMEGDVTPKGRMEGSCTVDFYVRSASSPWDIFGAKDHDIVMRVEVSWSLGRATDAKGDSGSAGAPSECRVPNGRKLTAAELAQLPEVLRAAAGGRDLEVTTSQLDAVLTAFKACGYRVAGRGNTPIGAWAMLQGQRLIEAFWWASAKKTYVIYE